MGEIMIWTQKEVSDFVNTVLPPGEKQFNHGYSEMVEFIDALTTAISEWPEGYINGPLLLKGLRQKWPEAVAASLREMMPPAKQVLESRPEPTRRLAYA
jgi:hypothetical protein